MDACTNSSWSVWRWLTSERSDRVSTLNRRQAKVNPARLACALSALFLCLILLQGCGPSHDESNANSSASVQIVTPIPDLQEALEAEVESALLQRAQTVDVILTTGDNSVDFQAHAQATGLVVSIGCVGTEEEETRVWVKIIQGELEPAVGVDCNANGSPVGIGEPNFPDLTSPITLEIYQEGPEHDFIYAVMAGSILVQDIQPETSSPTPDVT